MRAFIKSLIPPIVLDVARRLRNPMRPGATLTAPFENWQQAMEACRGYEDPEIIQRVMEANLAEGDFKIAQLTERHLQILTPFFCAMAALKNRQSL